MNVTSVLVAVGLTGAGALFYANWAGQGLMASKHLAQRASREALKRMLLQTVSCDESLPPAGCTAGSLVPLTRLSLAGATSTVVNGADPPTRFPPWAVRAECTASGDGIIVPAALLQASGTLESTAAADFQKDPLTGTVTTWSDPASLLFGPGVELCSLGRTPIHTESSSSPITTGSCFGSYVGGWCSGYYYQDITFGTPFNQAPAVIVSLSQPNNLPGSCPGTFDQFYAEATNVTTTGFRMICAASPNNSSCVGPYQNWYVPSACTYFAIAR